MDELWVFFRIPGTSPATSAAWCPRRLLIRWRVLKPGGIWRLATDWEEYPWSCVRFWRRPDFENVNPGAGATEEDPLGGWAPRWEGRTLTSFERKAQEAGRRASRSDFTAASKRQRQELPPCDFPAAQVHTLKKVRPRSFGEPHLLEWV